MNESTLNRMIREHKARIIWFLVFLILAVFVTALVFGTLRRSVQAQTYTKRVFECPYAKEGAEPVAHHHNDDCYENGELICTLPERELHIHGDECYAEEKVLVCTLEEGEGHVHTDACYTEEPVLVCTLEESDGHVHSVEAGCYTRVQGDLICTDEDPEHVHTDDCYAWEEVLTCEIPEGEGAHHHSEECYETKLVLSCGKEEGEGAHTHDDTCYEIQRVLICDKEEVKTEHVHTVDCFQVVDMSPEEIHALHLSELPESDPTADVESPDVWESRFASVPLSGHWDRDLLKIAETQLGYTESQRNFDAVLDENGDGYTLKGWTRYGAWYGIPYGDWCAMFISFCLNYADIPESAVPYDCATTTWIDSLSARGMYAPAGSYDPKPGDLIFFDWEGDGLSDHVGIVWAVNPGSITTIEGNHTPSVELFDYDLTDGHIQGYGIMPENPALAVTNSVENSEENESGENKNPDEAEGGDASASGASDNADPSNNNVDTENTEKTEPDPETLAKMPPFSYTERVAGIRVSIEADAGAFPEGTTVEIKAIEDDGLAEQVAPVVNGKVVQVQAVDITFYDAEGNEIEPLIPIRVTMRPNTETDEANGVEVVHVDNEGNVNAVTPDEGITQPDKGAAFDADSFSPYVLVYVLKFDYPVNGKTYESELAGGEDLLLSDLLVQLGVCEEGEVSEFVSKIDSVTASDPEALSVSEKDGVWTVRPMKESEGELSLAIEMQDGAKFSVAVQATGKTEVTSEDNNTVIAAVNDLYLPENAVTETAVLTEAESTDAIAAVEKAVEQETQESASVTETAAKEAEDETPAAVSQVAYQVFSISLEGVEYSKYEDGFQVSLTLPEGIAGKDFEVYHIDNDGNAQKLEIETDAHNLTEETQLVSTVSFVTPSFSDFVIRYTVDFHYKVNGNYYEFSFTGGSFVSLEKLLELLQIPYAPEPELESVAIAAEPAMVEEASGENASTDIEIADTGLTSSDSDDPDEASEPSESAASSVASESEAKETRVVYNDLSGITVSDTTRAFVANISSVTFTNPDLIWVGKVEEETTVGALREANNLEPEYSAELTEEQIAEIDAQTVTAGDWTLISLKPFQSEESLVITMNNGGVFKIRVTDNNDVQNYRYKVILESGNNNLPVITDTTQSDKVYLVVEVNNYYKDADHHNETLYYIQKIVSNGTQSTIEIDTSSSIAHTDINSGVWTDKDGNRVNFIPSLLGSETIGYKLITNYNKTDNPTYTELKQADHNNFTYINDGDYFKASIIRFKPKSIDTTNTVISDHIQFDRIIATNDYNYLTILGPAVSYGIVADHLLQGGHTQTNFAVNHYTPNGKDFDPNLSNVPGSVVIGQFSTRDRRLDKSAVIQLGNSSYSSLVLFVDKDSGLKENGKQKVTNLGEATLIERDGKELSTAYVQPAINYISSTAMELSKKQPTIVPNPDPNATQYTLNTTDFDDHATIYVNAENLKKFLNDGADKLIIEKKENQTIVFNFAKTTGELKICQFKVRTHNSNNTISEVSTGTNTGDVIGEAARHIVWNLNNVTGKVLLYNVTGIFLQPNKPSEICIAGTSTGWIASAGYVQNENPSSGEWHYVYSELPDSEKVVIRARKTVNNSTPSNSQTFSFCLDEYNATSGKWTEIQQNIMNSLGSITFNTLSYSSAQGGWHFYRIRENQNSNGSYLMDNNKYYAAVYVYVNKGHVVAFPPVYYSDFANNYFDPSAPNYPDDYRMKDSNQNDVLPTFNNTPLDNPGSVKVTKQFVGNNNNPFDSQLTTLIENEDFKNRFKITATWKENGIDKSVELTLKDPQSANVTRNSTGVASTYEWTISNLPLNTKVTFTEMFADCGISGYSVTSSATAVTGGAMATATAANPAGEAASFVNTYNPPNTDITIKKVDGGGETIGQGKYAIFALYKKDGSGSLIMQTNTDYSWIDEHIQGQGHNNSDIWGFQVPADENGASMSGLSFGEYELVEVTPPDGYVISNNTPIVFTVKNDGTVEYTQNLRPYVDYLEGNNLFTIRNQAGVELPNSGGPGTALYILLGGLMVVTAGAVLTLCRKKDKV